WGTPASQPAADPPRGGVQGPAGRVRGFYHASGPVRERGIARSRYCSDGLPRLLRFMAPPGQRVLDVGCGNGDQLAALAPSLGVGVDLSQGMIDLAGSKHPDLALYRQAAEELRLPEYEVRGERGGFDFVIMVNVVGELADVL